MRTLLFLLLLLLLNSCNSNQFLLQNGEAKSSMYTYYCNDSLGIYSKFFGDFSQEQFLTKALSKEDKIVLKKIGFSKSKDKILFHSYTKIVPYYNVIGTLKTNPNTINYSKEIKNSISYFKKISFDKINTFELLFPIQNQFFSVVFYEKNDLDKKKLINEIDYEKMIELTVEAIEKKECGKENILSLSDEFFNEDQYGNYLAFKKIQQLDHNYINTNDEGFYHQILSTYLSFAQQHQESEFEFNKFINKKKSEFNSYPISTDALIDSIKTHQVVLFNEAHHKPKHRYMVGSLLKPLYENGFRYIGLEAFYDENLLNKNSFPTLSNGFYMREATLANLIREAKNIGFTVFEYDTEGSNREVIQAETIYNKTIKKDKNAKVLILAGYSHIDEKDGWMAEQLKTKYNINPFTINQTTFSDTENQSKQPLELVTDDNKNFKTDLFLYNNLTIKNNCFDLRESKETNIAFPETKTNTTVLLIYNQNEFQKVENPIPVFVKTLEKNQANLTTNLCVGDYKVIIKNSFNNVVFESSLTVK